jgi:probable rRNA maturation factor
MKHSVAHWNSMATMPGRPKRGTRPSLSAESAPVLINRQRGVRLPQQALAEFLDLICAELRLNQTGLVVCMLSDAEIARINRAFRGKSGPTDVLSFPSVARPKKFAMRRKPLPAKSSAAASRNGHSSDQLRYLGDIAISPATAKRNAHKYGRTLDRELRILMLHGVLHLLGYDHETDHGEMNRIERKLRQRLKLA